MKKLLSAIVLSAIGLSASAQNLVTNGDFETTSGIAASSVITNSNLPGWSINYTGNFHGQVMKFATVYFSAAQATTLGATGTDNLGGNWTMASATDSPTGGKFVAIDGDRAFSAVLSQNISGLTIGQTYDLSFSYAGAQDTSRFGATTDSWQVTFGNQSQTTNVLKNASQGFTGWYNDTMTFTATSTSQLLSFLAVGTPSGQPPVSLLDGVSLMAATAPVPEPTTWALMLVGVGTIGFTLRKRRS